MRTADITFDNEIFKLSFHAQPVKHFSGSSRQPSVPRLDEWTFPMISFPNLAGAMRRSPLNSKLVWAIISSSNWKYGLNSAGTLSRVLGQPSRTVGIRI